MWKTAIYLLAACIFLCLGMAIEKIRNRSARSVQVQCHCSDRCKKGKLVTLKTAQGHFHGKTDKAVPLII